MLVALPSSVAFGVTVYFAVSPAHATFGALAGVLGAMALGLIAPTLGGTDRLISAPCAPAAAVLSAFAIEMVRQGVAPTNIVLMLTVLGILTGATQMFLGFLGIGRLIKFLPYPVVTGFGTSVGLLIIVSQMQNFTGAPAGTSWLTALISPHLWDLRGLAIGSVTVIVMFMSGRLVKNVPSTIIGIAAGALTYVAIAAGDSSMQQLPGNTLVIGPLGATADGYLGVITDRWHQIGELRLSQVGGLVLSAITLAALLSIDTLKTCVVLDQITRTRHDPNRELTAQGLANIVASAIGGMPGAGASGPTMVNLSSGGITRLSGVVEGVLTVLVVLLLGSFIAWIPLATLAGVLIVIGIRMIDLKPLRFLESRSTVLDFSVVVAVIAVAITVGLIAASAVGVLLSNILFLREQVGGAVVRRKSYVGERSSTWYRPENEMRTLEAKGHAAVIFELQGSLFFGTAQQLYQTLESEVQSADFLILDMQRIQSVDVTAAHILALVRDALAERNVPLLLSNVHEHLPGGKNIRELLELAGLESDGRTVFFMPTLEAAIEWVEARLLGEDEQIYEQLDSLPPLALEEVELFKGSKPDTLADLEACLEKRSVKSGETIFCCGEPSNELYLIRKGEVKVLGRIGRYGNLKHIATYGRGDFLGGLAFLDHRPRSNDAIATRDCDMFVLSLERFNDLVEGHKRIALVLVTRLASLLSMRLRHTNEELTLLQDT